MSLFYKNKKYSVNFITFKKEFVQYYKIEKFIIKSHYINYLYTKYNKCLINLNYDNLFECYNNKEETGIFCRDIKIIYGFDSKINF